MELIKSTMFSHRGLLLLPLLVVCDAVSVPMLVGTGSVPAGPPPGPPQCAKVPLGNRTSCGEVGIGKAKCLAQNCCYDDGHPGTYYCFEPPAVPPPEMRVAIISFSPSGQGSNNVTLLELPEGTFVNSATAGWLDQSTQHYYTLMQPPGASGIELFGMSLTNPNGGGHATVPMSATIGSGQFMSGSGQICGVDEDDEGGGPYVVCINPKTGKNTSAQTRFGTDFAGGMQSGDVTASDMDGHSLWVILASSVHPSMQGNFSLFSVTDGVLSPTTPPVVLRMPSPDLQGPEGLVHVAKNKLLAMTGEEQQGWGLVVIDTSTGVATAVPPKAADFGGPMHVRLSGSSILVPKDGVSRVDDVMLVALAAEMGEAMQMFTVDVGCVLKSVEVTAGHNSATNCVMGSQPLPANEPTNLALWLPQMD